MFLLLAAAAAAGVAPGQPGYYAPWFQPRRHRRPAHGSGLTYLVHRADGLASDFLLLRPRMSTIAPGLGAVAAESSLWLLSVTAKGSDFSSGHDGWRFPSALVLRNRTLIFAHPYIAFLYSLSNACHASAHRAGKLQHTLGVDVTKYVDGVRSTLPGRCGDMTEAADSEHVWTAFKDGCSVRVLHPQRWCDPLWKVRLFL